MDIMEKEEILDKASKRAAYLTQNLTKKLEGHPNIGEIRHLGLIHAMELVAGKEEKTGFAPELRMGYQIYKQALNEGLLLRPLGNVLYFNPPLVINEEEIDKAVDKCVRSIQLIFDI